MAYERVIEALADPTRRTIFERLRRGPLSVGRLADGMPVTRPAVSQHLRVLERANLVQVHRAGTRRICAVNTVGIEELRRYLDGFWTDILQAFAEEANRASPGGAAGRAAGAPVRTDRGSRGRRHRR
jgi:DNA-binding transcriptional ArsR family regulator